MSMRARLSHLLGEFVDEWQQFLDLFRTSAIETPPLASADASRRDGLRAQTCGDGLAAPGPTHPGAASNHYEDVARETLARLREACMQVVVAIDLLDPTPGALADAAQVTDIDAHRR